MDQALLCRRVYLFSIILFSILQRNTERMAYTAGRIYIQYSCVSLSYVPQAVNACYELYQMQKGSIHGGRYGTPAYGLTHCKRYPA